MKSVVRPELPTASVGSSQAPTAAVDNSAPLLITAESTYKSGKSVQTTGATSGRARCNASRKVTHKTRGRSGYEAVTGIDSERTQVHPLPWRCGSAPRRCTTFDINEIRKNIPAFVRWNKESEVPDVIDYADFQLCSASFATDAARAMNGSNGPYRPGNLLKFQYPNFNPDFPGKVRRFAIAQPIDQQILRHQVGRMIGKLDSVLSDRVCSFRLDGKSMKYLPWAFHSKQESWKNLTDRSIAALGSGRYSLLCRTDVRNYYPTVNREILEKVLRDHSCEISAVRRIVQVLEYWQRVEGLDGLPIGVEASAVLGNVFLEQVDRGLIEAGGSHFSFRR